MGDLKAVGFAPITYFANKRYHLLPLSDVCFDAGGGIGVREGVTEPPNPRWLEYLFKQGLIVPESKPAPAGPSMIVFAAAAGAARNHTEVVIEPTDDSAEVDITARFTEVYDGLALDTVESVLGSSEEEGSKPGMVRVATLGDDAPPPVEGNATRDAEADTPTWLIPSSDDETPSFTLQRRSNGIEADALTISVSNVAGGDGEKTFTLTFVWEKTATGIGVADLPAALQPLAFAIEVTPPEGGFKLPAPQSVTLSGGTDATRARATVPAVG